MTKYTRGDARSAVNRRTRASVDNYKARVLYFLRFCISRITNKSALSAPLQLGGKFALPSVVIPLGVLSLALLVNIPATGSSFSEGVTVTDGNYVNGALISLTSTEPASIELADVNTTNYLAGVVEPAGEGLIVSEVEGSNVYVATDGIVEAFVSDLNGEIKTGDFIGASWIKGVGMKALENTETDQKVLGVALQDQDLSDEYTYLVEDVETPNGTKEANVGKVSIKIFPRDTGPYFGSSTESGLEEFANNLTGKEVPLVRIIAALLLFSVAIVISGVFMTNGIKSSLNSLGRNPLASQSIFSTLTQISVVSVGLILVGATVAYVVLVI